jgi:hypothetical protein
MILVFCLQMIRLCVFICVSYQMVSCFLLENSGSGMYTIFVIPLAHNMQGHMVYIIRYQSWDVIYPVLKGSGFVKRWGVSMINEDG